MLRDIVEVTVLPAHRLRIRFDDGVSGEVNVAEATSFLGVFASLREETVFRQVSINPELGTVQWPNGADLDPDVLYAAAVGRPLNLAA
jgi:hypothetical protein